MSIYGIYMYISKYILGELEQSICLSEVFPISHWTFPIFLKITLTRNYSINLLLSMKKQFQASNSLIHHLCECAYVVLYVCIHVCVCIRCIQKFPATIVFQLFSTSKQKQNFYIHTHVCMYKRMYIGLYMNRCNDAKLLNN